MLSGYIGITEVLNELKSVVGVLVKNCYINRIRVGEMSIGVRMN
jgi:hypothetical protein